MNSLDSADPGRLVNLESALEEFADAFAPSELIEALTPQLTCRQAEAIVGILHAGGYDVEADDWLNRHVYHDTDDDVRRLHGLDL